MAKRLFLLSNCLHIMENKIHPEFINKILDEKAANLILMETFINKWKYLLPNGNKNNHFKEFL